MSAPSHHVPERHLSHRAPWLRAAVLGANDGIVSIASLVLGVAAAGADAGALSAAGVAGLVGGALSMAVGEYVSVRSQRDAEEADLERERRELQQFPAEELDELTELYVERGLTPDLARQVAVQLSEHDRLVAHAHAELQIDPEELARPVQAAATSALAFALGGLLPLVAVLSSPPGLAVPVTFASVTAALAGLGALSAQLGGAPRGRAVLRLVVGGMLAMALTSAVGALFGVGI